MKIVRRMVPLLLLCGQMLCAGRASAINASPRPVRLQQPDGTPIVLHIRGNEFLNWYEDREGYLVVAQRPRADAKPLYVYALPVARGEQVNASDRVVGKDRPPEGLQRHVPPPFPRPRDALDRLNPEVNLQREAAAAFSLDRARGQETVRVSNLVILMRFKNHKESGRALPTVDDFRQIFNAEGGHPAHVRDGVPSGSVRDFYLENSYGQFELSSTVVDWIDLDHTEAYYADRTSGGTSKIKEAIREALEKLQQRWTTEPNSPTFRQFDQDNDGTIDAIAFVHSGYGAEWGGVDIDGADFKDRIWSHRWAISTWASDDGVRVRDYHINPALWDTRGSEPGHIGVICHETGHFFGLPDLYDTSQQGEGIGSWGVMANSWGFDGTQLHPPHFSAWAKLKLGWIEPTILDQPGEYPLPQAETAGASIYRIDAGFSDAHEYLLIENRQPVGFDRTIPEGTGGRGGMIVWHVDERKSANNDPGFPGHDGWPTSHYMLALAQADGIFELEKGINRGDGDDAWRKDFLDTLSATTTPSTKAYEIGSDPVTISHISASGQVMTFRFNAATIPDTPLVTTSTLVRVASAEFTWDATNPRRIDEHATILQATIDLPEEMEVHMTASTSARSDSADAVRFTTGFYHEDTPENHMWPGSLRFVTTGPSDQWVSFTPTYAVRLPQGRHTMYWKVWLTDAPLEFHSGSLLLEAFPLDPQSGSSRAPAVDTLTGISPNRSITDTSARVSDAEEPEQPDMRALLVGIDRYASPEIPALEGCENDVLDMEALLRDTFGFSKIKKLVNNQATHAEILRQFDEQLARDATENTVAVFYFSGHGSRIQDDDPAEEADGYDESLVAHDSRTGGIQDMRDDEVYALISRLTSKGAKVTMIFDSCHSGTAARATYRVRGIPADPPLPAHASRAVAPYSSDDGLDGDGYVLLAACRSNEYSWEYYDIENESARGTLTYFLTKSLRAAAQAELTYRGLLESIEGHVTRARPQHPTLMGEADRRLFGPSVVTNYPYVAVDPSGGNSVLFHGGKVLGITRGSKFDVYAPGTRTIDARAMRLARVEVTDLENYAATARILEGGPVQNGSRAVERLHVYNQRPFPVFLDARGELADAVADTGTLQQVRTRITNDTDLTASFRLVAPADSQLQVVLRDDGTLQVRRGSSADGVDPALAISSPPIATRDSDAADRVIRQLLHWAKWLNVLMLQNDKNAGAALSFDIHGPNREGTDAETLVTYHEGDSIRLSVRNTSTVPFYFGIVNLRDDGSIGPVYPRAGILGDALAPGREWEQTSRLSLLQGRRRMIDHLLLVAFDQPVSIQFLFSDAPPRSVELRRVLPAAMAVFQARPVEPIEPDAWHTRLRTLQVIRPDR